MRRLRWGALIALVAGTQAYGGTGEGSFAPDSIRKPVRSIGLENSSTGATAPLYACPGTSEADCVVDVADEAAMAALFSGSISVPAGTYDRVYVSHCLMEGSYTTRFRGSVRLSGTTYYTRNAGVGADLLSTEAKDLGYVSVPFSGCRSAYSLPKPVNVSSGGSLNLSLFLNAVHTASAKLGPKTGGAGCVENAEQTQSLCLIAPELVPVTGSSPANLERYYILENAAEPGSIGASVLLVTDTLSNAVLTGFTRRYYSETSVGPSTPFETPIKSITPGTSGGYVIESYGAGAVDTGWVRFPAFKRKTHSGSYLKPDGTAVPYIAFRDTQSELPACPSSGALFGAFPARIDTSSTPNALRDFLYVNPLGSVSPTSGQVFPADHLFMALKPADPAKPTGNTVTTDIVSPSSAWVTSIVRTVSTFADSTTDTDYSVHFSPCREVEGTLDHVRTLSSALTSAFASAGTLGAEDCESYDVGDTHFDRCTASTKAFISAGSAIGTAGGSLKPRGVAFGAIDARIPPLAYVNPVRFPAAPNGIDALHVACPLDYYDSSSKALYAALLKGPDGTPRTAQPVCGTVMQDAPKSAQGDWFRPAFPTHPEAPHVALVHDHIVPSRGVFSIGNSATASGLAAGTYSFSTISGGRINRDFARVTDSQIYCYEGFSGSFVILIQLVDPSTLRIEKKPVAACNDLGSRENWAFSAYTPYNR